MVAAFHLGLRPRFATIVPERDSRGHVKVDWQTPEAVAALPTWKRAEQSAIVLLAGCEAERAFGASPIGSTKDDEMARRFGKIVCPDGALDAWMEWIAMKARDLLLEHESDVEAIAAALIRRDTLDARLIARILAR